MVATAGMNRFGSNGSARSEAKGSFKTPVTRMPFVAGPTMLTVRREPSQCGRCP